VQNSINDEPFASLTPKNSSSASVSRTETEIAESSDTEIIEQTTTPTDIIEFSDNSSENQASATQSSLSEYNPIYNEPSASLTPRNSPPLFTPRTEITESSEIDTSGSISPIQRDLNRLDSFEEMSLKEIIVKVPLTEPCSEEQISFLVNEIWDNYEDLREINCKIDFSSNNETLKHYGKLLALLGNSSKDAIMNLSNNNIGNTSSEKIKSLFDALLNPKNNNKTHNFFLKKDKLLLELKNIDTNAIEILEASAQEFFGTISDRPKNKNHLIINLSNNDLGNFYKKTDTDDAYINENPTTIWIQLAKITNLYELDLTNNNLNTLDPSEYKEMLELLLKSKSLRKLDMSGNNLTPAKIDLLKTFVEELNRYRNPEKQIIVFIRGIE